MQDRCGIVGISSKKNSPLAIYYSLYALQHRGQESAGIATYSNENKDIKLKRGLGLVSKCFSEEDIGQLDGNVGIGHVRYSTSVGTGIVDSQPFMVTHSKNKIAISHNGHIINSNQIRRDLENIGHLFTSNSDSEIIAHLFFRNFIKTEDLVKAAKKSMKKMEGSYSLAILLRDKLIALRDPHGIKPLCLGKYGDGYVIASESVALDTIGAEFIRDVKPGEMLIIQKNELESYQITEGNFSRCFFEHIYFARPDSIIDGKSNYKCRIEIGKKLGNDYSVENVDHVSPVPDSGITSAIGYSEASNTRYLECLMKNRYVGRTFIMPNQEDREKGVRLKLNTVKPNVRDKKIVLIDDSIVRGTTSKRIVKLLKNVGAEEIHLRVGSPPIRFPCHLGINMASREELIASKKDISSIKERIGVKTLDYISIEDMVEAIDIPRENLCLGCLTGKYPVEVGD